MILFVHTSFTVWQFAEGDGFLNFYLYNWRTTPLAGMAPVGDVSAGNGIGVVML